MPERSLVNLLFQVGIALGLFFSFSGCAHLGHTSHLETAIAPNEFQKLTLPRYTIEPPDVLQITAINLLPRPDHPIKPLDVIRVTFPAKELNADDMKALTSLNLAIDNNYQVELNGSVAIGAPFNQL